MEGRALRRVVAVPVILWLLVQHRRLALSQPVQHLQALSQPVQSSQALGVPLGPFAGRVARWWRMLTLAEEQEQPKLGTPQVALRRWAAVLA